MVGCELGNACSEGKSCGKLWSTGGTFNECEAHAISVDAIGFAYTGTGGKWCRMCTNINPAGIYSSHGGGVYIKIGTSMIIVRKSVLAERFMLKIVLNQLESFTNFLIIFML